MNTIDVKLIYEEEGDIILDSGFPINDGTYKVTFINNEGASVSPYQENQVKSVELVKTGNTFKLYLIDNNEIKTLDKIFSSRTSIIEVPIKKLTRNQAVINLLLDICPDIKKLMDISNFTSSIPILDLFCEEEDDNRVVDENVTKKNGKCKARVRTLREILAIKVKILERMRGRNFPVKGDIQSGKTKFMICTAVWFMLLGKSTIITLRNSIDDEKQIKDRILKFQNCLKTHLESHGHDRNLFKIEFVGTKRVSADILKGSKPKIIIAIYNKAQLNRINSVIGPDETGKFALCIDEADSLHKTVSGDELTNKGEKTAAVELDELVKKSFCSFSVSGTILDSILKKNIKVEDLIVLQTPPNYIGHNNFLISHLTEPCKFTTKKTESIIDNDPNLIPFLEKFIKFENFIRFDNKTHPNYCLMRVADVLEPMEKLFGYIIKKYPKIAIMVYNGSGVKIHHYLLKNTKSIKMSNEMSSRNEEGIHIFEKGCTPSHCLEWFKNNGGVTKFPHIITIAGDLATRGISYGSSDFEECVRNNEIPWHLTSMYVTFANGTDIPESLQITGRLCIVSKNNIPLTLFITEKDHENLIKGYNITEEFVKRAITQSADTNVSEFLRTTPIFNKKVPKYRHLTKTESFKPNRSTAKNDLDAGGWKTENNGIYIFKNVTVKKTSEDGTEVEYNSISPVTKDGVLFGNEIRIDDEIPDDAETIIDKVNLADLRKWFDPNCKTLIIGKIVKFLYNKTEPISLDALKRGINYNKLDKQLQSNIRGAAGGQYGRILFHSNYTEIYMNPKIKAYLSSL